MNRVSGRPTLAECRGRIRFPRNYTPGMRIEAPALLPLFRSEMQVELLGLLVLAPEREWTLEELTNRLEASQSSVHRELRRGIDAGLLTRDDNRRPHIYRAAAESPAHQPLRELLELTVGVPRRMADALQNIPGVVAAAIHGSWAAGMVRPDSDLDLVIVTDGDRRAAQRAVRRVGREIGREVDASVLSPADFEGLRDSRNPFLGKILHGPRIDVFGDLDEFRVEG